MNTRHCLLIAGALLLAPQLLLAQPGGGGRGGRSRGGNFGDGSGGSPGGGRMGMFGDPDQMFDFWAKGKDSIDLNSMSERARPMLEGMMQRAGITIKDGKITKEEFRTASEKFRASMSAGGFGGPGFGGRAPAAPPNSDTDAEKVFNKMDHDHDGQLSPEEMTGPIGESLLAEREKWDSDQDGFITLNEFKPFYAARMQQQQNERGKDRAKSDDRNSRDDEDLDRRPVVVYRSNSLPKEIPAWFAQLDTDQDAQISLYEWRQSGRPLEEFRAMDRSGDNLLTVEEVLLYVRLNKLSSSVASNGDGAPGSRPFGGGGPAINFTGQGGFNMGGFGNRPGGNWGQGGGGRQGGPGNWPGMPGGNWQGNGGRNRGMGGNGSDGADETRSGNGFGGRGSRGRGGNGGNDFGGGRGGRGRGGFGGGNSGGEE